MRLSTQVLSLLVLITINSKMAYSSDRFVTENKPFKFEMFFSDIFCWLQNGECTGEVASNAFRKNAQVLQKKLSSAKVLDFAIFGLRNQNWFLDLISDLRLRAQSSLRMVVDQEHGERGDFEQSNFVYSDTSALLSMLDPKSYQVDLNRDGSTRKGTIMHNKFIVADRKSVFVGSTNISDTCLGAEYNANHSIWIDSVRLAEIFTKEYEQMFAKKRFSREKIPSTKPQEVRFSDGSIVEAYFSPQDRVIGSRILQLIDAAYDQIDIAMFFLTSNPVAEALIEAKRRGVKVRIIIDASSARHQGSHTARLLEEGIELRIENWGGKMHMKSAVFDSQYVVLGSMNWSAAGEFDNDESTVIISKNDRAVYETSQYFNSLWKTLDSSKTSLDRKTWPRAEGSDSFHSCEDGVDNDHDGQIDSRSSQCQ